MLIHSPSAAPDLPISRLGVLYRDRAGDGRSEHYVPVAEFDGSGSRPCVAAHRATVARVLLG